MDRNGRQPPLFVRLKLSFVKEISIDMRLELGLIYAHFGDFEFSQVYHLVSLHLVSFDAHFLGQNPESLFICISSLNFKF
jgi:hypothetical protein